MNYEKPEISLTLGASFNGETEDGKKYTIYPNQNDLGNWTITPNEIIWENEKGTEDQIQEIINNLLKEMND